MRIALGIVSMSSKAPDLFQNLSLRFWYKYLLYIAGALLVLGVVFGVKLPNADVVSFSLWTMFLMIILWIYDDCFQAYANRENENTLFVIRMFLQVLFFLIWILIAFNTL